MTPHRELPPRAQLRLCLQSNGALSTPPLPPYPLGTRHGWQTNDDATFPRPARRVRERREEREEVVGGLGEGNTCTKGVCQGRAAPPPSSRLCRPLPGDDRAAHPAYYPAPLLLRPGNNGDVRVSVSMHRVTEGVWCRVGPGEKVWPEQGRAVSPPPTGCSCRDPLSLRLIVSIVLELLTCVEYLNYVYIYK
ncbi:hypothetical protein E2C01_039444 [Portunus trituberculatus]|uniref:Uncharacterized protein n=1 Tax=Portunus trituberculatus TaxID=210409 RepID=A0A5B7FLD5_PORTR|nr:hypothetical protein [Portunus trituberculatus]